MIIRAIILCTTLLLSVPLFAQEDSDVIVMKNGDHFTRQTPRRPRVSSHSAAVLEAAVCVV